MARSWEYRNLEASNNSTFRERVRLGKEGDFSWNLNETTMIMEVRPAPGRLPILVRLTTENGGLIIIDPLTRVMEIVLTLAVIITLPAGRWVYDLVATSLLTENGNGTIRRLTGEFVINAGVVDF